MDFAVFSHLRWNFVFQRPQHLMTRCSAQNRVLFWEEPIFEACTPGVEVREITRNLAVAVPHLPPLRGEELNEAQGSLWRTAMRQSRFSHAVFWYYTPMALRFSANSPSRAIVYDCMDELTAFRGAPEGLRSAEADLLQRANLVFTGGKSLYECKRHRHISVHCFPSSIDREFFSRARNIRAELAFDQAQIPRPRLGYCGVIDERMDLDLLAKLAETRPEWQLILVGPVVKIAESDLPRRSNIHYLGQKQYSALPSYFAGWDVGLLPFARNESTRYISPTKTPEYLAAGLPAVSTPIPDVVDPYGVRGLVHIAETPDEFVRAIEEALPTRNCSTRLAAVDRYLRQMSWDSTWNRMNSLISEVVYGMQPDGGSRSTVGSDKSDGGVGCLIT